MINPLLKALLFVVVFGLTAWAVLVGTRTCSDASPDLNSLPVQPDQASGPVLGGPNSGTSMAYIRSEEVARDFRWMALQKDALKARLLKAEKEWEGEASRFQKDLQDFQRKAAGMGESQRQMTEQSLARREQNLVQMREGMVAELAKAEEALDTRLRSMMDVEFKAFAQKEGFDYLWALQPGSGLLYGDSARDATRSLVDFLNQRHPR
jgi:outer membrane protein